MPRVIINAGAPPRGAERLVARLAQELDSPGEGPLPLIIETHLPKSKARHVYVVWDDWGELDDEERSAVIAAAYGKVEGEEAATNITIALGMGPHEAVIYGLLPYAVHPARPKDADKEEYRKAIAEEANRTALRGQVGGLRYPTIPEAIQAMKRLKKALPRSSWGIVKEAEPES